MSELTIVIPAYNEATEIDAVVRTIPSSIRVEGKTFNTKTVVVNDCSKDDTAVVAKSAGAVVVSHIMNSGAGAATRTGLKYVLLENPDTEYVVTIDADGQHSPKDIKKLLKHAVQNNSMMIVGSRLHDGNKESMPFHRRFGNVGLSLISRILFGIKTKDTQSGLRLFRRDVLAVVSEYNIDRYGFCTEMLWLASRAGINVEEVPISVRYSKESLSKGQNNWGVIHLVRDLLWLRISR